ncbi:MAG TPA: ASKHA domain-containing protein [Phycisphaerae bacterium]|nr:ASKHA domain-containing protein [Phycisphaerae bacterium]
MTTDRQLRVTFQPQGRSVHVLPGTTILEAAARAGLTIDTPCGGQGTCGKCRVQITQGASEASEADRRALGDRELSAGWRLACQTTVRDDCAVQVPSSSLFASQVQILTEAQQAARQVQPAVRKVYVELAAPTLADPAADLKRLEKHPGVGEVKVDLGLLRQLPRLLREADFAGTAVITDRRLIGFEPGDTRSQCLGVAVDLGTTTLVGSLLDLCTGEERGIASAMNPQVRYGDDVLSRIEYCTSQPNGADDLRRAVVGAINELITELCRQAQIDSGHIYEVAVAGNTTMEHLLCGIDVAQLGQVPFAPAYARGLMLPAAELEIGIAPHGAAYVFPVIGGFVGGDTSAGILATRLDELDSPSLMVDIGTNGEIVLCHAGRLWAASTAAGPAFEGARISCGMRAASGAVEKVVFDGELHCSVIADAAPAGICGSGLIDLAAELLRHGVISPEGRLRPPDELPKAVPDALRRRCRTGAGGQAELLLTDPQDARPVSPVTLTYRDVRELQLATAAIRAGVTILLQRAGVRTSDLKLVLIAGGFGSFIRRSNAQRIGLLPAELDHQRIHYVGNASLNGARCALVSTSARKRAEQLAQQIEHVELSQAADFQTIFADSMIFPNLER